MRKLQDGEGRVSSMNTVGKRDIHRQKKEVDSHFTPYTKISSQWIKDLNGTPETITPRRKHGGQEIS